ncbi:MAG TPA: hypothetical protein VM432_04700, partial [Bdellovibrionales bacterium]|nr:hypothetical protein [Bdellovibrionales bacterium]
CMKEIPLKEFFERTSAPEHERVLSDSIGDAFLYDKNPVFRGVRNRVFELGFRPTANASMDYFGWPMLGLDEILETRLLPYKANLRALKKFANARPGHFVLGDVFRSFPERNFIFHESCHAIAEDVWARRIGIDRSNSKTVVERSLFGEACANGSELFSYAFTSCPEEEFSLIMNSYFRPIGKPHQALKNAVAALGAHETLKLTVLFYFHVNYFVRLTLERIDALIDMTLPDQNISADVRESIREIAAFASTLNEAFRKRTGELFLNFRGVDGTIEEMTRTTEEEMAQRSLKILPMIDEFAKSVIE